MLLFQLFNYQVFIKKPNQNLSQSEQKCPNLMQFEQQPSSVNLTLNNKMFEVQGSSLPLDPDSYRDRTPNPKPQTKMCIRFRTPIW